MEGVLLKWTNYWNGWQTRWFVLNDGILSYYRSAEEVNQGCKGSMKVSAIEITVNPVDNTRMDISIPGEKNMYLRAPSSQERQHWLVALGSSKACLTHSKRKESVPDSSPEALKTKKFELRLYCDLLMQQVHSVKTAASQESGPDVEHILEGSKLLSATCDTFIKTLEDCMKLSSMAISVQENNYKNENEIRNLSQPTVPVMRMNSTEK
ncbi:pleckstrin homology domain-containing family A member 3-like isoform X2 [Cimex lectularius]|nr:pleckstrin homology domain-containing family A member 3-like isoform X2 [Cimex lectularius]